MDRSLVRAGLALIGVAVASVPASAQAPLEGMTSLDSLLNIPIETASKYAQAQRSVPASTVVVTSEEINRFGYQTLGDVLSSLPGFYGSYDRNYYYLGVRGFGRPADYNNRILLLLDGHPLNENIYGGAYIGTAFGLDIETVERIEIVRGPGSALYGSSAMFAVVNVIPKRANDVDGIRISGGAGSFGSQSGAVTFGQTLPSGLEVTVSGSLLRSSGQSHYYSEFDTPGSSGGLAQGIDGDEARSGYASLAWNGLSLTGFATSRRKDIPTAPWETVFNEASSTVDERAFGEIRVERSVSDGATVFARGFVDTYYYHGEYPYSVADGGDYSDESYGRWFGGEARLLWDMASWNRLTAGGELRRHSRAEHPIAGRHRTRSGDALFAGGPGRCDG